MGFAGVSIIDGIAFWESSIFNPPEDWWARDGKGGAHHAERDGYYDGYFVIARRTGQLTSASSNNQYVAGSETYIGSTFASPPRIVFSGAGHLAHCVFRHGNNLVKLARVGAAAEALSQPHVTSLERAPGSAGRC